MSQLDLKPTQEEVCLLADFFLESDPKPTEGTLQTIAEIVGVAIGLKPAAMRHRTMTATDRRIFQNLLQQLHLQTITEEIPPQHLPQQSKTVSSDNKLYDFFISRDLVIAKELQSTLHASLDLGWRPNDPKNQRLSYKIGRLLGYPETAARYFAYGPRDQRGIIQHRPDSDRDRYYIHSPDHFRTEYEQFEDILHAAIAQLSPQTASYMQAHAQYSWTSKEL